MVMGGDSHSEGRGFEFQHRILDGHYFPFICCKNCNDCKDENVDGPFFTISDLSCLNTNYHDIKKKPMGGQS